MTAGAGLSDPGYNGGGVRAGAGRREEDQGAYGRRKRTWNKRIARVGDSWEKVWMKLKSCSLRLAFVMGMIVFGGGVLSGERVIG